MMAEQATWDEVEADIRLWTSIDEWSEEYHELHKRLLEKLGDSAIIVDGSVYFVNYHEYHLPIVRKPLL